MSLILAEPVRLDLLARPKRDSWPAMRQGSTFSRSIFLALADDDPIDLTDYKVRTAVRETYDDETPVLLLTTENGGHEVTDEGEIKFYVSPTTSALVSAGDGPTFPRVKRYIYDTEVVTPDDEVFPLMTGHWEVVAEVTTEE